MRRATGRSIPNVAIDLNNLAQLLQATNRLAEAEPLMRRALAIDEASYGAEHPDVAIDLNNLAQLLQATNRLAEAEPLSRRTVLIFLAFTRDTGHEHPHLRAAIGNYLGLLLAQTEDPAEIAPRLASLGPEAGLDEATWQALLPEVLGDLLGTGGAG
jgi:tetratricopeptide (TPR) repeat protein